MKKKTNFDIVNDLPFFLVTYGASITSNNNCEAVRIARKNHIEWEKEHGFNPN